jgi:hypothetical protein
MVSGGYACRAALSGFEVANIALLTALALWPEKKGKDFFRIGMQV